MEGQSSEVGRQQVWDLLRMLGEGWRLLCMYRCKVRPGDLEFDFNLGRLNYDALRMNTLCVCVCVYV
jgi:hypothetical protein